jgi:putative nucleotidyltransferase with HDIG domain
MQRALESLTASVNSHDTYTAGHSTRVAGIAGNLALMMRLRPPKVRRLRQAGLVHDIGKVAIPEKVLTKNGRLSDEERHLVQLHPIFGASILSRVPGMDEIVPIVLHHHERWDGGGYPSGLEGTEIPLGSRIVFVADAFDAMTTERPYGTVFSVEEAVEEIARCAEEQFDPEVVKALQQALALDMLRPPQAVGF